MSLASAESLKTKAGLYLQKSRLQECIDICDENAQKGKYYIILDKYYTDGNIAQLESLGYVISQHTNENEMKISWE